MSEIRELRIGPYIMDEDQMARGDCPECGGDCDGEECGLHAAGCIFGGFSYGYWLIADGCPRDHGEAVG